MAKISFISLGCPKNQIDGERMLAALEAAGHKIAEDPDGCDIVIVNTCAFIDDAKKEAIETVLDMVSMKEDGMVGKVIVTGCLAERYGEEVLKEIPEADAVCGIGANADIVSTVDRLLHGETCPLASFPDKLLLPENGERHLLSPEHYAYLKIADGCSNGCTYCVIPKIRGRYRSRPTEDIVAEAEKLVARGVRELILVAQDTTRYGEDLYGENRLVPLIRELAKIDRLAWIRLLYCYPERLSPELIELMREEPKLLHYLDIPMQHADGAILRAMGRVGDGELLLKLIQKLREEIPDITLRTSLIAGFPGESEEAFEKLAEFVRDAQFDRMGCFAYSREEGTRAYSLDGQLDEQTKLDRAEIINEQQRVITEERARQKIGTVQTVMAEGYDGYTDSYIGRTTADAPEIDRVVRFTSDTDLEDGAIVSVRIFDAEDGDLIGQAVREKR